MTKQIHILYIPGFGGSYDGFRRWVLRRWRFADVSVEMVAMKWNEGTFTEKIDAIDDAIDRARGKRIVLIGESAGGSMAMHMYARRPNDLHKVMTICGKNSHPETVGSGYLRKNPAFRESMDNLNESLSKLTDEQREKFVSIHPYYDPVVPVRDTLLPGCQQVKLWAVGHLTVIALALTVLSPIVVRAAKQ
jgi:pimeloyl-ACP methyl ester carboxylesterase